LSDLVALNEEMAALVRSGASLEQGLVQLGSDFPGQLGGLAERLGQRLQSGESLMRILEEDATTFPPIWRGMVAAGIRSGRLAVVLESLAATGRRISEMRRTIGAALIYPIVVVVLAYLVFVFLVTYLSPVLVGAFHDLTTTSDPIVSWLAWLGVNAAWWVFWPPAALGSLLAVEWLQTSGFQASDGPLSRMASWCWPSIRRSRREARLGTFTEILSLLIREQTPLPEAIILAANASGDDRLRESATKLAERLASGQTLSASDVRALDMPPLLGFMLSSGANRAALGNALAETAARYRERSTVTAARIAMFFPILLTVLVGGAVTLTLGLTTVWPIWRLMLELGSTA
jgi:general secretion pathway protein F